MSHRYCPIENKTENINRRQVRALYDPHSAHSMRDPGLILIPGLGQLSLASLRGRLIEYQLRLG